MTGQKRFAFGKEETDMSLRDAGLGKMTGLRVVEIEQEQDTEDILVEGSDEDDDSEDNDDDEK